MKKIAVVCSGWHFASGFYERIAQQVMPEDWQMDLFCISHREPEYAIEEKDGKVFEGERGYLDAQLYAEVLSQAKIEALGWCYELHPNTIGDWGNSNQWLHGHDYKEYDLLLFTHDDNLILSDKFIANVVKNSEKDDWDILGNSAGMPPGSLRGSCEFFRPYVLDLIGGKFDLSDTKLTREGMYTTTEERMELYDWNSTVYPLARMIANLKLKVSFLSPWYRVSQFCLEGERGFISNTWGQNTVVEDEGLRELKLI